MPRYVPRAPWIQGLLMLGVFLPLLADRVPARAGSDLEALPPPKEAVPDPVQPAEVVMLPGYFRTNRYDVWQFYGVDRRGGFRPRVVYSPSGPYVLYNGAPYPFAPMHALDFMPYVVD
jgi:hypothetical protein